MPSKLRDTITSPRLYEKMEAIVQLLEPVVDATNIFQADDVSISVVLPTLSSLCVHAETTAPQVALLLHDDDTSAATSFKTALLETFRIRCGSEHLWNIPLLAFAALADYQYGTVSELDRWCPNEP